VVRALTSACVLAAIALAGCGGSGATSTSGTAGNSTGRHPTPRRHTPAPQAAGARTVPVLVPPTNAPERSVQVPVLTYHRVVSLPAVGQLDLIVDPANFAAELAALHAAGYHTISQAQLFDAVYHGAALPSKPIIISVDDGYVDDVRTILPDLERWHMVATFFVITGRMTEPGFLNADQIRGLDRAGMDVGDHTAHHVDLRVLTAPELRAETAGSRATLQAVVGHPVYYFAYPFGAYNDTVIQALRAAGFTMAYTTNAGTAESSSSPLTMPRLHIGRDETPSRLVARLGGA
jgi:peptidoglycan/xylan/chitin deacetylase (PgdA/CDA1 family)